MNTNTMNDNLKGMAKHTYNRVINVMSEDKDNYMSHTFSALTNGAKSIVVKSGYFSNAYIRGEFKEMNIEESAKDLEARAAALVSCKLRKIDHVCALAFLAEYISRQRKANEAPAFEELSPAATNSELSHAGQCLDIYLYNTAEIYERYTVEAVRFAAGLAAFGWDYVTESLMNGAKVKGVKVVDEAINAAVRMVKKYDYITPTAKDIEQIVRDYAAYIVECAQYEIENAKM